MLDSTRWWARLALLIALAAGLPRAGAAQVCVGDCNGDGSVTVDELTRGVASRSASSSIRCPATRWMPTTTGRSPSTS